MINNFLSRQFLMFLVTGGTAAAVNFGTRILYSHWLSFSNAVILAYVSGMMTAYILAKIFVFKESTQSTHRSVLLFVLVNAVAVVQTWAISMVLAYYILPALNINIFVPEIAHGVGVVVPVFTSYIGHKKWTFR